MAKYYVESGRFQTIVSGESPRAAAVKAVQTWSDEHPLAISALLGLEVEVNEQGFARRDGERFETFDLLAASQGLTPREYFLKLALAMCV
jgi:hypothetical protein